MEHKTRLLDAVEGGYGSTSMSYESTQTHARQRLGGANPSSGSGLCRLRPSGAAARAATTAVDVTHRLHRQMCSASMRISSVVFLFQP